MRFFLAIFLCAASLSCAKLRENARHAEIPVYSADSNVSPRKTPDTTITAGTVILVFEKKDTITVCSDVQTSLTVDSIAVCRKNITGSIIRSETKHITVDNFEPLRKNNPVEFEKKSSASSGYLLSTTAASSAFLGRDSLADSIIETGHLTVVTSIHSLFCEKNTIAIF